MPNRLLGSLTLLLIGLVAACTGDEPSASSPTPAASPTASATAGASATATAAPPVMLEPGDELQRIVEAHPAGSHFILTAGIYREQTITPRDGDVFEGEAGAILSGARELEGFSRDGELWSIGGQRQQGQRAGGCSTPEALAEIGGYDGCRFPEQLFFDDQPLWQVTARDQLASGRWYFDYDDDRIYVADDPTSSVVEASTTAAAIRSESAGVTIRGLVVEKYSAPTQQGAIHAAGASGWVIEDNELRLNHGYGLRIGPEMEVRDNSVHHNGQLGIGGIGSRSLLVGNEIAYNHTAGFNEGWEAGGLKLVRSDGLVIRDNWVHHNAGRGIWTDIDVINLLVEDNLVESNSRGGIVHEISYAARIVNNVASENGLGFDPWLWGAQILVQNSSDVEVSGNVVTVSAAGGNGITVVNQDRGSGNTGPYVSNRVTISDNTIRHLGEKGTSGSHSCRATNENVFDANTYEAPAVWFERDRIMWCELFSWAEFQAAGFEPAGTGVEIG